MWVGGPASDRAGSKAATSQVAHWTCLPGLKCAEFGSHMLRVEASRPDRIVDEIPKYARESIKVGLRENGGTLGRDLRVATATGSGPMK